MNGDGHPNEQLESVFDILFDLDNAFSSLRAESGESKLGPLNEALDKVYNRFARPSVGPIRGVRFLIEHRDELKLGLKTVGGRAEETAQELKDEDERELVHEIAYAAEHEIAALYDSLASVTSLAIVVDDHYCVAADGYSKKLEQLKKLRNAIVAYGDLDTCRSYLIRANEHLENSETRLTSTHLVSGDIDELRRAVDRVEVALLQHELLEEQ